MRSRQNISMLVELALGQLQHARGEQLVLVAHEQREGFPAGNLGDRVWQQRLHHHGRELRLTCLKSAHVVDLLLQSELSVVPVPAGVHGAVGGEEECVVLPTRDLRVNSRLLAHRHDLLASQLVQNHRLGGRVHVQPLAQLPVGALAPRVHVARGGETRTVTAATRHGENGGLAQRRDLQSTPHTASTTRGVSQ